MFTVYAIYNSEHDKLYVGQTEDLQEHLKLHNEKSFSRSFAAQYSGNWELIYSEQVSSRSEALKREKQLKSYRGRQFLKTNIPR